MNRRRVLQSAGALATVGLAGCIEGVQEHFGLQGIIPMEIHSEADRPYNIQLQAQERDTGRETYDEGYSVTPGEAVYPPNLEQTDQSLQVVKFDENTERSSVSVVSITEETELVLIYVHNDDIEIELEGGGTVESESATAANESSDGDETDSN